MGEKTQFCSDLNSPKLTNRINVMTFKIPAVLCKIEINKTILEFIWNDKETRIDK